MRAITLALILLLLTPLALAEERVARQGDHEARVFNSPCVSIETINRIPENRREGWSKATGRFNGNRFFGCWRLVGDSVYILWEDGDQGIIPLRT